MNSVNEGAVYAIYSEFKCLNGDGVAYESSTKGNLQAMFLDRCRPRRSYRSGFLSSVQNIHPPNGFSVADLTKVDLGRLQILMS